jgi:hypothetical protein
MLARRLLKSLWAPALLLILTLVFGWDLLSPAPGEGWWGLDVNLQFYPFSRYVAEAFKESRLPLWNPYQFLGSPFLAEPQAATFYPVTRLFLYWPVERVIGWSLIFHLWWAALGLYTLVRSLGGREEGAVLGGVVLAFSGFVTTRLYAGHYVHLMTWSWTPWMLGAFHWAYRRRSLPAAVLAGIPVGLGFLAGFVPFWAFGLLALGLWALYLGSRETGRRRVLVLGQLGLCLAAGALLAGAQLLPTLQFAVHSSRVGESSYEYISRYALPLWHLFTALMPDLFGSPLEGSDFWAGAVQVYWEGCLYLGVSIVLLVLLSGPAGDWRRRFFLSLGGGGLLVSLGQAGVVHALLYRFLPGFGLFRVPARAGMFYVLAMAVLSGLALDHWLALSPEERGRRGAALRRWLWPATGIPLAVALLAILLGSVQADDGLAHRALTVAAQSVRFLLLFLGGYALFGFQWRKGRMVILLLALMLVDLWGFGSRFLLVQTLEPPDMGWIMADLALSPDRHAYRILPSPAVQTNDAMRYSFLSTDGYDSLVLSDAHTVRGLLHGQNARLLDLFSVRYLMVGEKDISGTSTDGWEVVTQPAGAHFYEREQVGPRAFVVHDYQLAADHDEALARLLTPTLDPYATAVLESPAACRWESPPEYGAPETGVILGYEPERVTLEVEAAAGGLLVLGDLVYPGWRAEVDGQAVPVHRVDYALRGVCVPAGKHRAVFTFDPPIVRQGVVLSQMGLAVMLLAAAWRAWELLRWAGGREGEGK